jgi:hypothetical protein
MLEPVMDIRADHYKQDLNELELKLKQKGDLNIERDVPNVFANLCEKRCKKIDWE